MEGGGTAGLMLSALLITSWCLRMTLGLIRILTRPLMTYTLMISPVSRTRLPILNRALTGG